MRRLEIAGPGLFKVALQFGDYAQVELGFRVPWVELGGLLVIGSAVVEVRNPFAAAVEQGLVARDLVILHPNTHIVDGKRVKARR
ncbi:hypothetical protein NKDENANG_02019 [Candidatus Entotheonellaceae bacterium PAL068K]